MRAQLIQVLSDRNAVGAVAALLAEAAQPGPRVRAERRLRPWANLQAKKICRHW
ncbi:MAG: hypothetical protein ACYSUD_08505 [Planctomycetota bacterium]